nr:3035_t:CDS:2 [Entrophospora candida]
MLGDLINEYIYFQGDIENAMIDTSNYDYYYDIHVYDNEEERGKRWKKERESMNEAEFLEYKQNFEAKMKVPTTPHKKELKNKSIAIIEYV